MGSRWGRSLVKGITYRFGSSVVAAIILWVYTGKISVGVAVLLIDALYKIPFYFFHERIWKKISWGKTIGPAPIPDFSNFLKKIFVRKKKNE